MNKIVEEEILNLGFYHANDPFLGKAYFSNETIELEKEYHDIHIISLPADSNGHIPVDYNIVPKYLICERYNEDCYVLIIRHSWSNQDVEYFSTKKELVKLLK